MVIRDDGPATDYEEIDRFDDGVGWLAHPDELMARASHALVVDGDVWVFDPVDAPGVDDLLDELGAVEGVVVTGDRHGRDAAAFARRQDAPLYVPSFVDPELGIETTPFSGELADTGFRVLRAVDVPGWHEAALYDGDTLLVADAVGRAQYFTSRDERLGVHPLLRPFPPRSLRGLTPDRVLAGHGPGVFDDATTALTHALDTARSNAPGAWLNAARSLL